MSRTLSSPQVRLAFAAVAALGFLALLVGLVIALFDWIGGTDPEEEIATIEEVTIAYGASEGPEGCEFLSASVLDQLGGESGCTREFETVPPAEFEVLDVALDGEEASVRVENLEPKGTKFSLQFIKEDDQWKISNFPFLDQIAPSEGEVPGELVEPPSPGATPPDAPPPAAAPEEPPPEEEPPPDEGEETSP
jgi:hypothetical protein